MNGYGIDTFSSILISVFGGTVEAFILNYAIGSFHDHRTLYINIQISGTRQIKIFPPSLICSDKR